MKTGTTKIKNLQIALSVFIFLGALTQASPLYAATTTYVSNSSTGLTYEGEAADGVFTSTENQFAAGEYSIISTDGADYVQHDILGFSKYQYHRFDFTIAEDPATITQINVTWKGFGGKYLLGGGGGASFTGETEVETSSGLVTLEKLYEIHTSQSAELPTVTFIKEGVRAQGHIREVKQFPYTGPTTVLTLSNGKSIRATPYHEILIDPLTDRYLRADELTVGMQLVSSKSEETITVTGINTEEFSGLVYDLTIEEFHNFSLGAGVFVHNTQALDNYGQSLWVKESGTWTKKTSGTATTKETLTVQYTTNFANLISSGHMHVGAQSDQIGGAKFSNVFSALNSYYAEVVVTYTANSAPNAPGSLGAASYVNGSTVTDTSPTLDFSQSDTNGGDTLKFQIQIDDTSNFSSPVVDYTSALIAQGATSFTVGQAAGSGTYTTGGANTDLNNGSYYWRVRSNDNALWGNYATANSGAVAFVLYNNTYANVTSTADTNTLGTLRYALNNRSCGFDEQINFDSGVFPSGTPATINVTSALPAISCGALIIEATNRGVIINGSGAGSGIDGFMLGSNSTNLRNLQIKSFGNDGVRITGNSNTVQNCQIYSNGTYGIEINGTSASNTIQSNTIYSNGRDGIYYTSTGATSAIKGNYIGTNSAWSTTIGNVSDGIEVNQTSGSVTIGGTSASEGNWLCKNGANGITITNGTVNIYGNYVGTNSSGATNIGNTGAGIGTGSSADALTIGSSASTDKNVIGANGTQGIDLQNSGSTSTITANYIGTDSSWRDLENGTGNQNAGVGVYGTGSFIIGGALASDRNFIAFHNTSTDSGIWANAGTVTIKGNYIGTNTAGTPANIGNYYGIRVTGGTVTIGSTTNGEGNVIGYNTWGILATVSTTTVVGNFIGMNSSYASAANVDYGIYVNAAAITPTIGGTAAGSANFIGFHAGAGDAGIYVNDGSPTIKGNYIGTNASGTNLANTNGIALAANADAVTIGGTAAGAGNVISLNSADGINTASTNTSIVVQGNFIGTDSAGTASWPNGGDGIDTTAGTITIGNASEAQRNIIGPNTGLGINPTSASNPVVTFAGTVEINDDVTFTKGTANLGSGTINVFGNWTTAAAITVNPGSSTVIFDGSSSQTITTNAKAFYNVTLNNTGAGGSDLITPVGNFDIDGTLTLTNGVLTLTDAGNPNVTIAYDLTINNSADPGITRGSGTWTFDGTNGSSSFITDNTSGIDLGAITLNQTATPMGEGENDTVLGSNVKATSITVDGTGGSADTLSLGGSGFTLTLTGNGTPLVINGSFDSTNSTVKYAPTATTGVNVPAATYANVEFNKASNSFMLQGNIDVNGNLTITAGTLDVDSNGNTSGGTIYDITVAGNWANSGTFQGRANSTGTVTFDGSTTPVTLNSGGSGSPFNKLTISKTLPAKKVNVITNNLVIGNTFNLTTGTLDMSGTSLNVTVNRDTTIGTNGRFTKGTGTFNFSTLQNSTYTDSSSNGPQNLGIVTVT